jgi:hypothetical protein
MRTALGGSAGFERQADPHGHPVLNLTGLELNQAEAMATNPKSWRWQSTSGEATLNWQVRFSVFCMRRLRPRPSILPGRCSRAQKARQQERNRRVAGDCRCCKSEFDGRSSLGRRESATDGRIGVKIPTCSACGDTRWRYNWFKSVRDGVAQELSRYIRIREVAQLPGEISCRINQAASPGER